MIVDLSPQDEERYLREFLPLVKTVVKQLSWQVDTIMDRQDMEQIALMGLLEALRRYGHPDESFISYAKARIRGAILDECRRLDWRPRDVRQKTHRINNSIKQLENVLGREASFEDIEQHLNLSVQEYQNYLVGMAADSLQSFDALFEDNIFHDKNDGDSIEEQFIKEQQLAFALSNLNEREQMILSLYYQHELSLKEISLVLELTEARVCQLNKEIIKKLKKYMS